MKDKINLNTKHIYFYFYVCCFLELLTVKNQDNIIAPGRRGDLLYGKWSTALQNILSCLILFTPDSHFCWPNSEFPKQNPESINRVHSPSRSSACHLLFTIGKKVRNLSLAHGQRSISPHNKKMFTIFLICALFKSNLIYSVSG